MKFWKRLKYWQKGIIISVLVEIIVLIIFTAFGFFGVYFFYNIFQLLLYLPREISYQIIGCLLCPDGIVRPLSLMLVLTTIEFILAGSLIGFIIGKIKGRKSRM